MRQSGVHSGLAFGAADDLISAFAAMRQGGFGYSSEFGETSAVLEDGPAVPTIVFHGDRDAIVDPHNADHVIARSMKTTNWQKKVHRGQVPGGHAYTRTIHTDENGRAMLEQMVHPWSRTRLVGWQSRGFLHRSAWAGRIERNAALLSRSPCRRTRCRSCKL